MKKALSILFLSFFTFFWTACETKYDMNGDLDGMWQMLRWYDKQNAQEHTDKSKKIYYCVQLKLMKFQKAEAPMNYYLAYFTHRNDSLILGKVVHYPTDSVCNFSALKTFGVPDNGKFSIDALSSERMVLSTDSIELTFRKY